MVETGVAVSEFERHPRERPPFDLVFLYQSSAVDLVAMTLFFHFFQLIMVFSAVNAIKRKLPHALGL